MPLDALPAEPPGRLFPSIANGVRRRWLVIFVLGGLCAGGAGALMWALSSDTYTARATLKIGSAIAGAGSDRELEVFKANQRQLVYHPLVIDQVVLDKAIGGLSVMREQGLDGAQWLRSVLRVSFPDKSEYMEISLTCENREEALKIVNAIAVKYEEVAEGMALARQDDRRANLDASITKIQEKMGEKHEELAEVSNVYGSGGEGAPTDEQKLALTRLSQVEAELFELGLEIGVLDRDLQSLETPSPPPESPPDMPAVAGPQHDLLFLGDKGLASLERQVAILEERIAGYAERLSPELSAQYTEHDRQQIERLGQRIEERKATLVKEQQQRRLLAQSEGQVSLRKRMNDLRTREQVLKDRKAELTASLPEIAAAGTGSIFRRFLLEAEIETLESLLGTFSLENERAILDQKSITDSIEGTPAAVPYSGNKAGRYVKCGVAGGFAWFLAGACVVVWDIRRRRLSTTDDVMHELGMPLIGTVPLLKRRGRAAQVTSTRLTEAVDGIAATLLCGRDGRRRQIVQISSASPGEGKSTLAANLATSLAGAGRNTLLIDFDLRRPVLHRVYEVELGPGVSDILTGAATIDDALQPAPSDHLTLLTAGNWRQKGLGALTDARIEQLFQECRARFDFVIVDSSPVLPVVDGRLVSRHVDGVIISLLRDVSEVPRVGAACQMLDSFGAPIMGGVMIGSSQDVYYGYSYGELPQTA
jgi:capsular exopolysaccharide synthesis family protein